MNKCIFTLMIVVVLAICSAWLLGSTYSPDLNPSWLYDSNNTGERSIGSSETWEPPAVTMISVRSTNIELVKLADCNDAEIARFGLFMQLAIQKDAYYSDEVWDVLIARLVSPKLVETLKLEK